MIAQYRAQTKYGIEAFKNLGRISNRRPEAPDVINKVGQYLKLHLVNNFCRINQRKLIQDIADENF